MEGFSFNIHTCVQTVWCADAHTSTQPNMDPERHCLAEAVLRAPFYYVGWKASHSGQTVCIRGISYLCVCAFECLAILKYSACKTWRADDAPTPCNLPLTPCTGLSVGQCAVLLLKLLRNCPRKESESLVSPPGFKMLHIWIWLSHYYTARTLYCTHDPFLSLHLSVLDQRK